jgi:hypothetical protein
LISKSSRTRGRKNFAFYFLSNKSNKSSVCSLIFVKPSFT